MALPRIALAAVGALALTVAAHAGAAASKAPPYSARDLPRILDPQPILPKAQCAADPQTMCSWSVEERDPYIYPTPAHAPAFTLRESLGESPSAAQKAEAAKLKKAGFQIGRHHAWTFDSNDPNLSGARGDAVVYAYLFRDVAGARTGFRVLLSPQDIPPGAKKLPTKGLGEEARGFSDPSADETALYLWRRGNLVVVAFAGCETACDGYDSFHQDEYKFSPVPLARAYAYQIGGRSKRPS